MKCSNCGMELTPSSPRCAHCGRAVARDFNYHNMENELLNTVLEDENMTAYAAEEEFADGEEESEFKKRWGMLAAALLAVAAVFAGAVFSLRQFPDVYEYEQKEAEYQNCLYLMTQKDYDKALDSVALLLKDDKKNLEYLSLKNTICAKAGTTKAQIKVLRQIIAADPDNYPAYEQLLELYLTEQKQTEIAKLAENPPNSVISSMIRACIVDAPYFELPSGVYESNQLLEITSEQDHEIYYTLDGTSPKENGILYEEPVPLEHGYHYVVTAVCKNDNGTFGDEASGEYRMGINAEDYAPPAALEQPEIVPQAGTYTSSQLITITVPIGMKAYYSWTLGKLLTPENGTLYTGGIAMPEGESVLTVILADESGNFSEAAQAAYTYDPQ